MHFVLDKPELTNWGKFQEMVRKLSRDIAYQPGGWTFFIGRFVFNAMILYFLMAFMKGLVVYSFMAQGVDLVEDQLEVVRVLVWCTGIIYLVLKTGDWKK